MADPPAFVLPGIDASPEEEAGIVLLGLDAERLLAGLGLSCLADELAGSPALVTTAVDRARHGDSWTFAGLVHHGAGCWRTWRPVLDAAGLARTAIGSVRGGWADVAAHLARLDPLADVGAATRVHLTACWLRRADVDRATPDT